MPAYFPPPRRPLPPSTAFAPKNGAAKYVPLDRLYLSPQCGFASCEIGNKLTEEEQWAKLALVMEIAEEV